MWFILHVGISYARALGAQEHLVGGLEHVGASSLPTDLPQPARAHPGKPHHLLVPSWVL